MLSCPAGLQGFSRKKSQWRQEVFWREDISILEHPASSSKSFSISWLSMVWWFQTLLRRVLRHDQCCQIGSVATWDHSSILNFFYRRSLFTINNAHSKNIVPRTWPTKFSTVKATKRTSNARVWQLAPTWRRQPGNTSKVWLQPRVQSGDSHALPGLPTGWTAPTAGAVNPSVLNKFSQWSLPDCLISFED